MDIDYLRVWQKGAAAENPTAPAATTAPIATVAPTMVNPTLYCLGSCPTTVPTEAVIPTAAENLTTAPTEGVAPTDAFAPSTTPCGTGIESVGVQTYDHDNNDDSGGDDSSGNFFEQLLQLLKQLIELIKQLLGGGSPTTPTQPGTPSPTPCPIE
jgi:hypothetical protein